MKITVIIRGQPEAATVSRRADGRYLVTCQDGFIAGGDTLEEACDLAASAHGRKPSKSVEQLMLLDSLTRRAYQELVDDRETNSRIEGRTVGALCNGCSENVEIDDELEHAQTCEQLRIEVAAGRVWP